MPVLREQDVPLDLFAQQCALLVLRKVGAVQPDPLEHRAVPGLQDDLEGLRDEPTTQPVVRDHIPRGGACFPPLTGALDHRDRARWNGHRSVDDTPEPGELRILPRDHGIQGPGVAGRVAAIEALEVDGVARTPRRRLVSRIETALVERPHLIGSTRWRDSELRALERTALQPEPEAGGVERARQRGGELRISVDGDPSGPLAGAPCCSQLDPVAADPWWKWLMPPDRCQQRQIGVEGAIVVDDELHRELLPWTPELRGELAVGPEQPAGQAERRLRIAFVLHRVDDRLARGVEQDELTVTPRGGQQGRSGPTRRHRRVEGGPQHVLGAVRHGDRHAPLGGMATVGQLGGSGRVELTVQHPGAVAREAAVEGLGHPARHHECPGQPGVAGIHHQPHVATVDIDHGRHRRRPGAVDLQPTPSPARDDLDAVDRAREEVPGRRKRIPVDERPAHRATSAVDPDLRDPRRARIGGAHSGRVDSRDEGGVGVVEVGRAGRAGIDLGLDQALHARADPPPAALEPDLDPRRLAGEAVTPLVGPAAELEHPVVEPPGRPQRRDPAQLTRCDGIDGAAGCVAKSGVTATDHRVVGAADLSDHPAQGLFRSIRHQRCHLEVTAPSRSCSAPLRRSPRWRSTPRRGA